MNIFQITTISYTKEIFHCNIGQYYSLSTHASDFRIILKLQYFCHVDKIRQNNVYTFSLMKSELYNWAIFTLQYFVTILQIPSTIVWDT